jgi:phosphatidylserine/phosphatidylglycerophosphate/cardiolipin synthase-like enzyme
MGDDLTRVIFNRDIYTEVIEGAVLHAERTVWIATADLKDLHVKMARGYKPILELFDDMAKRGVRFRVIHAKIPSGPFRNTLDKLPALVQGGLELQVCPRSHWKMVIVDGRFGYYGSANFTGAGLGVRNERRRNLEVGAVSEDPAVVKQLARQFDQFWMGAFCGDCAYRDSCPDPI